MPISSRQAGASLYERRVMPMVRMAAQPQLHLYPRTTHPVALSRTHRRLVAGHTAHLGPQPVRYAISAHRRRQELVRVRPAATWRQTFVKYRLMFVMALI